jgi:hypothetical protein
MRRFVLGWKMLGLERSLGSRIVTYADDLVILCQRGGEEALARMRELMGKLKLTVNEEKTRSCKVPAGEFNLLGCTGGCTRRKLEKPICGRSRLRVTNGLCGRQRGRCDCRHRLRAAFTLFHGHQKSM